MSARLLYVVNIPRFFCTHRLPLALAARGAGYEVHVATSDADRDSIRRIEAAGLPFHPLPLAQHGMNPLAEARTLAALVQLYRRLKPQIVHLVSIKPVLYGGIAARLCGIPAVVGAMSGLGYVFIGADVKRRLIRGLAVPLMRWAMGQPNARLVLQNPDDQARLVRLGVVPAERSVLIRGSGVDPDVFTPQPPADGPPVVLYAGRLMAQKGLLLFLEAARALHGRARFVIAGYAEPTSPGTISPAEVGQWAREGWVEWWGARDDMPAVIAASHIVTLPSLYGEGVPRILIEAGACARPIVTTDTPGCRDIVTHGVNGLTVAAGDAAGYIRALARLIDDAALRAQMGAAGRQRVLDGYTLRAVNQQMLALYAELLGARPRP